MERKFMETGDNVFGLPTENRSLQDLADPTHEQLLNRLKAACRGSTNVGIAQTQALHVLGGLNLHIQPLWSLKASSEPRPGELLAVSKEDETEHLIWPLDSSRGL